MHRDIVRRTGEEKKRSLRISIRRKRTRRNLLRRSGRDRSDQDIGGEAYEQ